MTHFSLLLSKTEKQAGLDTALLLGLLIVTVAIQLPFIGGAFNLVATVLGLGLITRLWLDRNPDKNWAEPLEGK